MLLQKELMNGRNVWSADIRLTAKDGTDHTIPGTTFYSYSDEGDEMLTFPLPVEAAEIHAIKRADGQVICSFGLHLSGSEGAPDVLYAAIDRTQFID